MITATFRSVFLTKRIFISLLMEGGGGGEGETRYKLEEIFLSFFLATKKEYHDSSHSNEYHSSEITIDNLY